MHFKLKEHEEMESKRRERNGAMLSYSIAKKLRKKIEGHKTVQRARSAILRFFSFWHARDMPRVNGYPIKRFIVRN